MSDGHPGFAQVAVLYAAQSSLLKDIPPHRVLLWLSIYVQYLWNSHPQMMKQIAATQALPPDALENMESALQEAYSEFGPL